MTKDLRTGTFRGHTYRYWAHDAESIRLVPGWAEFVAQSPHDEETLARDTAAATVGTFEDEADLRERYWKFEPGDVVIDAGAAGGSYTITAAVQGAKVVAYEPNPFCRELLFDNLLANQNPTREHVITVGLYSAKGWFNPDNAEFREARPWSAGQWLPTRTVDQDWDEDDRLDFLKLDIEGAELDALKGAEQTIRRFRPKMLIEEHDGKRPGVGQACREFVESLGLGYRYETSFSGSGPHTYFWVP